MLCEYTVWLTDQFVTLRF